MQVRAGNIATFAPRFAAAMKAAFFVIGTKAAPGDLPDRTSPVFITIMVAAGMKIPFREKLSR
jgi:hypothetical protein